VVRTSSYILRHAGWRVLVAAIIIILPMYAWVLFYSFSTGAWNQSPDLIRGFSPLLATFFVPLLISVWIVGFRGWYILIVGILAALITGWLPASLADQLLPNSYVRLAVTLLLLTLVWRAFLYWRDYAVHKLPVARYSRGAVMTAGITALCLVVLLLPIRF
jgi:hypothetical protein